MAISASGASRRFPDLINPTIPYLLCCRPVVGSTSEIEDETPVSKWPGNGIASVNSDGLSTGGAGVTASNICFGLPGIDAVSAGWHILPVR